MRDYFDMQPMPSLDMDPMASRRSLRTDDYQMRPALDKSRDDALERVRQQKVMRDLEEGMEMLRALGLGDMGGAPMGDQMGAPFYDGPMMGDPSMRRLAPGEAEQWSRGVHPYPTTGRMPLGRR